MSIRALGRALPRDWPLAAAGVATIFVVWDLAVRSGLVSALVVPPPLEVFRGLGVLVTDRSFPGHGIDTLLSWVATMLVASAFAVPVGLLMGYFAALYRPASMVVHALRSVPAIAMIPIAILVFGLGPTMKIAVSVYATSWPLLLNSMYGVRSAEGQMITAGRSLRWGRGKLLRRVILPAAAPSIATGFRLAATIGLLVLLATELLGARSGLATLLIVYEEAQRPEVVYAGILVIGSLGLFIHYALSAVERLVIPWAHAQRRGEP